MLVQRAIVRLYWDIICWTGVRPYLFHEGGSDRIMLIQN